LVSIEGANVWPVTWAIVEDVRSGVCGIGGPAITVEAIRTSPPARNSGGSQTQRKEKRFSRVFKRS